MLREALLSMGNDVQLLDKWYRKDSNKVSQAQQGIKTSKISPVLLALIAICNGFSILMHIKTKFTKLNSGLRRNSAPLLIWSI